MNKGEFNAAMARNEENQTILAKAMGMPQSALSARINGKMDFRQSEIQFIRDRYHLTCEMVDLIFFDKKVS